MKILLTGVAGFIGFHLTKILVEEGHDVVTIDAINDYYDTSLKYDRLSQLGLHGWVINSSKPIRSSKYENLIFYKSLLEDTNSIAKVFKNHKFDMICHLAAQAGVRFSIEKPMNYIYSNIVGHTNLINLAKDHSVEHFIYASSSSVYGLSKQVPFSEEHETNAPISVYAGSKISGEIIAHTYNHLFGMTTIGLRFFTVYGSWGRPDMAIYLFTKNIVEGKPINVFNNGKQSRDFTHVNDITKGIYEVITKIKKKKGKNEIYNIGRGEPVRLMDFISEIEKVTGKKAKLNMMPKQPGDVLHTYADTTKLQKDFNYKPKISISEGIQEYYNWFREYYG